jgi:hypothetical protein
MKSAVIPPHYMEASGQLYAPAIFPPKRAPYTHWIWGWIDSRDFWNLWRRESLLLPGIELRSFSPKLRHYVTELHRMFNANLLTPCGRVLLDKLIAATQSKAMTTRDVDLQYRDFKILNLHIKTDLWNVRLCFDITYSRKDGSVYVVTSFFS